MATTVQNYIYNYSDTIRPTITGPLTYVPVASDGTYDFFQIEAFGLSNSGVARGQENISSLTVSAVPELSTWAMMLGFAGLGLAGVRSQRASLA
jgi:hypothetical protein